MLFVPSVEAQTIVTGGQLMADALKEATGMEFEVMVPTSYPATIEELCASPNDSMAFMPPLGYVLANQLCGVEAAMKAERYGNAVYWAGFYVRRDSGIETFADLAGKTWGFGEPTSVSGYLYPLGMLKSQGITTADQLETGGHPQSIKAVYDGSVDFCTAFYTPPLKPEGEPVWAYGDDPDIPEDLITSCVVDTAEETFNCGGWIINDVRSTLFEEAPDAIETVTVLALTTDIPNDPLVFGPEFPSDLRDQIVAALLAYSETEEWKSSLGSREFYNWTGIIEAQASDYDPILAGVQEAGLTLDVLKK
jgi:phosphonate transport system substrate-binding protein